MSTCPQSWTPGRMSLGKALSIKYTRCGRCKLRSLHHRPCPLVYSTARRCELYWSGRPDTLLLFPNRFRPRRTGGPGCKHRHDSLARRLASSDGLNQNLAMWGQWRTYSSATRLLLFEEHVYFSSVSEVTGKADTFRQATAVRGDCALFVPAAPPVFAAAAACIVQPGAARFATDR
jgi:hypothetical protein